MVKHTLIFFLILLLLPAAFLLAQETPNTPAFAAEMLAAPAAEPAAATPSLAPPAEGKGRGGAFLRSLLIPGWGQHAMGAKGAARGFIVAEVLLVGSAVGLNVYGNWINDDMRAFAAGHALVDIAGKDDRYWVDIGNFNTIHEFNAEKLRQRNTRDLRDPAGADFWAWDSPENRRRFEDLRIKRDQAKEASSFAVAGVVANHVVSALHALWLARKAETPDRQAYRFGWRPTSRFDGGAFRFSYSF